MMKFLTSGEIARKLEADHDAVAYALRKKGVKPLGTAGQVRIFHPSAIEIVQRFLHKKALKA